MGTGSFISAAIAKKIAAAVVAVLVLATAITVPIVLLRGQNDELEVTTFVPIIDDPETTTNSL